ncbi:MAG TPA: ATP-binding protein [Verrucomicrobiae bacterium]|nr:ATP-binding protein [Verrucomicrobiae bacterium]
MGAGAPWLARLLLAIYLITITVPKARAQESTNVEVSSIKHVLMIFSEARDLPGNVLLEQSVKQEILAGSTNSSIEFFTESLDASRNPGPGYEEVFGNYLRDKYADQKVDLVLMFMARNFALAPAVNMALATNIPSVFVALNDQEAPFSPGGRPFTGIYQHTDIDGTIKFIFRLQPETRQVVVIGGVSANDQKTLARIADLARTVDGVKFEFWTNQTVAESCNAARTLTAGTVILLASLQRDSAGQPFYTAEVAQMLAPGAGVPVYVLGEGAIGTGALGGSVVNFEALGADVGKLALAALNGEPMNHIPVKIRTTGTPMVDWRALQRWNIRQGRLPIGCEIRYQPQSLWEEHQKLILFVAAGLVVQAVTIVALLVQRRRNRRAQAQIERQRTELAHVSRVSTMGQFASALTHELNQPLGAILRNAEAAELFLQNNPPNLEEVRAILTDIRRDDKRAGNVIDRMRALYQRRSLVLGPLDLCEVVNETIALTRIDAEARHVRVHAEMPPQLPAAHGDRVHLQQVLLNLILNGMEAMTAVPRARRSLVIRASETKNGNLQVAVMDRGAGIMPEDAARIFEPFFTTKLNGMGMGLAISQTIIEAHGGDIWVESKGSEGATFTFILPPAGLARVKDGDLPENL